MALRASGSASGKALLHRFCSWSRCSGETSAVVGFSLQRIYQIDDLVHRQLVFPNLVEIVRIIERFPTTSGTLAKNVVESLSALAALLHVHSLAPTAITVEKSPFHSFRFCAELAIVDALTDDWIYGEHDSGQAIATKMGAQIRTPHTATLSATPS